MDVAYFKIMIRSLAGGTQGTRSTPVKTVCIPAEGQTRNPFSVSEVFHHRAKLAQ